MADVYRARFCPKRRSADLALRLSPAMVETLRKPSCDRPSPSGTAPSATPPPEQPEACDRSGSRRVSQAKYLIFGALNGLIAHLVSASRSSRLALARSCLDRRDRRTLAPEAARTVCVGEAGPRRPGGLCALPSVGLLLSSFASVVLHTGRPGLNERIRACFGTRINPGGTIPPSYGRPSRLELAAAFNRAIEAHETRASDSTSGAQEMTRKMAGLQSRGR